MTDRTVDEPPTAMAARPSTRRYPAPGANTEKSPTHVTRWGDTGPVVVMVQGSRSGGDRHFARQECLASLGWQIVVPDRPDCRRRQRIVGHVLGAEATSEKSMFSQSHPPTKATASARR